VFQQRLPAPRFSLDPHLVADDNSPTLSNLNAIVASRGLKQMGSQKKLALSLASFGCVLMLWTSALSSRPSPLSPGHPLKLSPAPRPVRKRPSSSAKTRGAAGFRPIGRLVKSSQVPGTNFAAASYSSGGYLASSVAVADINGDGTPDVLAVNECASTDGSGCVGNGIVSVLLNNGDGTFQPATPYASGGYQPLSVVVADVNGDGKPDLLVANSCTDISNCDNGAAGVLLGNGDGTFQPAVTYNSGGYQASSVASADVNRDGILDLLVANQCATSDTCVDGGQVAVLLGNGDGTFQPAVTYSSGGYQTVSVAVSDVNGDGYPDVLLANHCADDSCASSGTVSVLVGNGDGTFQAAVTYGSGGFQAASVFVADVNGDGVPDLLVANNCVDSNNCANGVVGVLLGKGDGTFQPAVPSGSGGYNSTSIVIADVNGDATPDLLVTNQCANNATCATGGLAGVLLGNGDGTFQNAMTYASGGNQASSIAVSDVNGDGKPDILIANQCFDSSCTNGAIGVLINISTKPSTTALSTSVNPSGFGQPVTLTATVTPSATGTITFTDGANTLGTATLISGAAALSTTSLNSGTHTLTASYSGDSNFAPSASSTLSQVVNQASTTVALSSSQNPGYLTQPVTFTATVASQFGGAPSGSVTLYSGNAALGNAALTSGQAVFSTTFAATGAFSISAAYGGDSNNATSTSSVLSESVTRIPTSATISSNLNPSNYGQAVTFTATITFTPGTPPSNETVNFKELASNGGEIQLGTSPLTGNTAIFSISTLSMGTHNIKAQYLGDKVFMNCHSVTVAQVVNKASTSTVVSSSLSPSLYGQAVTFTATVTTGGSGTPTGKVTFKRGSATLGNATLSGGSATFTTSTLNTGSATVTATYAGDSYNSTSTSPALSQQVNKAPTITALTSSPNPSTSGQPVTFTATLSSTTGPVPTGTVTFKNGNTTLCSGSLTGGAVSCNVSTLSKGSHTIKANYITTANFLGSSASVTQTVN
jgi:hypothetical protein